MMADHQSTADTRGHELIINIVTADGSQHQELNNQLIGNTGLVGGRLHDPLVCSNTFDDAKSSNEQATSNAKGFLWPINPEKSAFVEGCKVN